MNTCGRRTGWAKGKRRGSKKRKEKKVSRLQASEQSNCLCVSSFPFEVVLPAFFLPSSVTQNFPLPCSTPCIRKKHDLHLLSTFGNSGRTLRRSSRSTERHQEESEVCSLCFTHSHSPLFISLAFSIKRNEHFPEPTFSQRSKRRMRREMQQRTRDLPIDSLPSAHMHIMIHDPKLCREQ